jgi:hypothetical protein
MVTQAFGQTITRVLAEVLADIDDTLDEVLVVPVFRPSPSLVDDFVFVSIVG